MNMCVKTNGKYDLQSKLKPGATEAPAIIFIFSNGYEGKKRLSYHPEKGKEEIYGESNKTEIDNCVATKI